MHPLPLGGGRQLSPPAARPRAVSRAFFDGIQKFFYRIINISCLVGVGGSPMAKISEASEAAVSVTLVVDGVLHDGRSHRKGDVLSVPSSMAAGWRGKGWVRGAPRLRALLDNRLIGTVVCQAGMIVDAPSVSIARSLHESGTADWLNAPELGEKLPDRNPGPMRGLTLVRATQDLIRGEGDNAVSIPQGLVFWLRDADAMEHIRQGFCVAAESLPGACVNSGVGWVLVTVDFTRINGARSEHHQKDTVILLGEREARETIAKGYASPVGWSVGGHPRARFKVIKPVTHRGRTYAAG